MAEGVKEEGEEVAAKGRAQGRRCVCVLDREREERECVRPQWRTTTDTILDED